MLSNDDRKDQRRMRLSRRTVLSAAGVVATAGAIAGGVTLAQADKPQPQQLTPAAPTAPLDPAQARAHAQQLHRQAQKQARQLAHERAANPHPGTPKPSRPAKTSRRARAAATDAALSNAADLASTYGVAAAPGRGTDTARATVPVEIATGVELEVLNAVLRPTDSGSTATSPNDTLSVVQVPGKFTVPGPPPAADQPDREPISAAYLIVVTDEQTGEVLGMTMGDKPVALSRLSTAVAKTTLPQK